MTEQDDSRPRAVFARLETICGCIRFIPLSMTLGPGGAPQSVDIPTLTKRDGITARTFRRDLDPEDGSADGVWAVGDVLVLAYREDAP